MHDRDRLEWVDALRGIAALSVAFLHITLRSLQDGVLTGWSAQFANATTLVVDLGKFGVVLFFCISGYVIPPSIGTRHDTAKFVLGRFFRLYPLYWVSIALALLFPWGEYPPTFSLTTILVNLTMLQGFVGIQNVMDVYWTLQIELVFYGLCVAMAWVGLLHNGRAVLTASWIFLAIALAMAVARWYTGSKLPVAMPLGLAVMLWASSIRLRATGFFNYRTGLAILLVAIPLISIFAYSRDYGYSERWDRYVYSYFLALCVFMAACQLKLPVWRPLVFAGTVSYSIYLLHPTVYAVLEVIGLPVFLRQSLHPLLAIAVQISAAVAVSAIAYVAIEHPFQRIGKAVRRRMIGLQAPLPKQHASAAIGSSDAGPLAG